MNGEQKQVTVIVGIVFAFLALATSQIASCTAKDSVLSEKRYKACIEAGHDPISCKATLTY